MEDAKTKHLLEASCLHMLETSSLMTGLDNARITAEAQEIAEITQVC